MSNSALANYVNRITPNFGYRQEYISAITIRGLGEPGDIYDMAEFIASGSTAYHYGIAGSGTIGLFVDEMYAVYASGNNELDDRAVQIIVMDYYNPIDIGNPGDTSSALHNLVEDICRRNYILKLEEGMNIFQSGSYQVSISEINSRLTSARMSSESEVLKAQSSIAVGAIHPFMAIIDPAARPDDFDCYALRNMGCVGALMHAGSLYDQYHNVTKPFKNPYLKKQMEKVIEARMHWALLITSRAYTLQEAKEELYWFYFVVAKYGPKLGVWVQPEFDRKKVQPSTAQDIIELYYTKFVRWGLKDKCGLYCTRDQAEHINWPNFVDRMSLWLNEPTGNDGYIDELLTPSLFKLEE